MQYIPGKDNIVADAMSRFAYRACKTFQDTSSHGSEVARQEVREIIEQELAEARTVALICHSADSANPQVPTRRVALVAGTVSGWKKLPTERVMVVTRGGNVGAACEPESPSESEIPG